MKYIKDKSAYNKKLIENVNLHKTSIKNLGEFKLPEPKYGDLKLSVMPFENNGEYVELPEGFKMFEESFNNVLKQIPLQEGANKHYVTIDTKFFTNNDYLRREGVHIDGNFCVDPNFRHINEKSIPSNMSMAKSSWGGVKPTWGGIQLDTDMAKSSWGGVKPTWGGIRHTEEIYTEKSDNSHVTMDWVLPYDITIPVSEYVSGGKGGILTVSTEPGCRAWKGTFEGEILSEGACDNLKSQLTDNREVLFEKNQLYFMSSNTPHETLMIEKGKRRTFLRITLNHNYDNSVFKN